MRKAALIILATLFSLLFLSLKYPVQVAANKALSLENGTIVPLYPVIDSSSNVKYVGFVQQGDFLSAIDQAGKEIWKVNAGAGTLFGGFDFDLDGWQDIALAKSESVGTLCGTTVMKNTWITFLRGKTGDLISGVSPTQDKCWDFGSTVYPTTQFNNLSVLFGPKSSTITVLPYYAATGWFFNYNGTSFNSNYFIFPSTTSFNSSYPNASVYRENAHTANGLMLNVNDSERLLFFTSNRVSQYTVGPFSSSQLLYDNYFNSGGRTDTAGRNYGLVAIDPNYSQNVVLVAGTSAYSTYVDMNSNSVGYDAWGQIERHVTIYNYLDNILNDRFYSYAHDNNDGNKYQNRVAYPNNIFIKTGDGKPSRLAYNVFTDGHWYLHISEPGKTDDKFFLKDIYLWDINDLDNDGTDELIISPVAKGTVASFEYYFPDWNTTIYHWDELTTILVPIKTYTGVIPYLTNYFRQPTKTTSFSYLYPVLSTLDNKIIFYDREKNIKILDYGSATNKIKGDANGDGVVSLMDYFYYVASKVGAKIPTNVNSDFDGNGIIDNSDGATIIQLLKQ